MDNNDKLYNLLSNFNRLSLDQQGELTGQLDTILDRLADGVWVDRGDDFVRIRQCSFCCVKPGHEHAKYCPVKLARGIRDEMD